MSHHRILIITNRAPIATYFAEEVRASEHELVLIMTMSPLQQPSLHDADTYLPDIDLETLVELSGRWGITAAIYASTTSRVPALRAAAQLREKLASSGMKMVAHPVEILDLTLNKWRCQQFLKDRGVSVPDGLLVEDVSKFHDAAKIIGYPIVMKLLDRSGGMGLHVIQNEAALAEVVRSDSLHAGKPYLVEKLIEGTEYSIEVLISERGAMPLTVVNKGITGVESTHPMSRPRVAPWTGPEASQVVKTAVAAALAIGGYGVLEFDIVVSTKAVVLEVNPRLGGITFMGLYSGGYTTLDGLLEMAIGDWHPLPESAHTHNAFVAEIPVESELTSELLRRLRAHPAVRVAARRPLSNSNGNVTISGTNPAALLSAVQSVAALGVRFVSSDELTARIKQMPQDS
jgi:carbamoylphosphate synthase large subunit